MNRWCSRVNLHKEVEYTSKSEGLTSAMSKQGNMNISRVTNEQMQTISEILPQLKQPIKPRNTQGYGFEQVLRKEQEKLMWSITKRDDRDFLFDFIFDISQFVDDDGNVDEDSVENYVDCKVSEITNKANVEYKGYSLEDEEVKIHITETTEVRIIEHGRYEEPDLEYELECPELKISDCIKIDEVCFY